MSLQGFNVTLQEESPVFSYFPQRDSLASEGWNASYTNSTVYDIGGWGSGIAYRSTTYPGATVTLLFEGIGVYLCFRTTTSYNFTVDGASVTSTASPMDDACVSYGDSSATLAVADELAYGTHEAVLTTDQSGMDFWFYGGLVTLSVGAPGTTVRPRVIDDADPAWSYVPGPFFSTDGWWRDYANNSARQDQDFDGGHTWCCAYAQISSATYSVTGASALELYGIVDNNTYGYSVFFNGSQTFYNGTNLWRSSKQVLFFFGGLDPNHTYPITITNFDPVQPEVPSYYPRETTFCLNIDAILVQEGTATVITPPGGLLPNQTSSSATIPNPSSSTNSSATSSPSSSIPLGGIIGVAVGVVVLILAIILGLVFWRRRVKTRAVSWSSSPQVYPTRRLTSVSLSPTTFRNNASETAEHSTSAMRQVQSRRPASGQQSTLGTSMNEVVEILSSRRRAGQVQVQVDSDLDVPPLYTAELAVQRRRSESLDSCA